MKKNEWPLVVLILAVGIGFWNLTLPSPLQPYIAFSIGISLGKAAQLVTVSAGAAIGALLVYGLYGKKIAPKYVLWFGLGCLTVGSWLVTTTENYSYLLFIRVLNGIADGLIYPSAWVAIADYLPRNRWRFGNQMILIGTALAAVIGLPLANQWASSGEWQTAFKWFTVAGLAMFLLSFSLTFAKEYPHTETATGGFRTIWSNTSMRWLVLSNIFAAVSWFGVITFVGGFLNRTYHPSTREMDIFFVLAGLFFTVGSFIYSEEPTIQSRILWISGFAVAPMAFVFFFLTSGFWITTVIASIYALLRAPGLISMETSLLDETEKVAARVPAIAALDAVTAFGTLIGAALGGIVLSQGTYTGIGSVFALCASLSLVFFYLSTTGSNRNTEARQKQNTLEKV